MWTYWRLREGEIYHEPAYRTAEDRDPPVLHGELLETPVEVRRAGRRLERHLYVYWKIWRGADGPAGVQGGGCRSGSAPRPRSTPTAMRATPIRPSPPSPTYFAASLGQLMGRFAGCRPQFRERRNGGIGAFTPDNLPVLDWARANVYLIADSGHGYKMTGIGKLVARHIARGDKVAELAPFSFDRYAAGRTFGAHNSNSPWV